MIRSLLTRYTAVGAVVLASLAAALPVSAGSRSEVLSVGSFTGVNDHVVTGGITIVETEAGTVAILDTDFSLDNAPDPKLAFGSDGVYDPSTLFSPLESLSGAQMYVIPDTVALEDHNEFWLWCERFNVGLGVAPLEK